MSIDMVPRITVSNLEIVVLFLGEATILISQICPNLLWGPTSSEFNGYHELFPW